MFQIDLLKGQARPANSNPMTVAGWTLPLLVPIIAVLLLLNQYRVSTMDIQAKEGARADIKKQIHDLAAVSDKIGQLRNTVSRLEAYNAETIIALRGHKQWSQVLVNIVENLPGDVAAREISLRREEVVIRDPGENRNPRRVYRYSMRMLMLSDAAKGATSVQDFIDSLRRAEPLGREIENIRLVSNTRNQIAGQDMSLFEIEMTLKLTQ